RLPAARLALAGALHGALLRTGRRPPAGTDPGAALDRAAGGDTDAVAAWQTAWGQAGPGR
ncbi:MAG: hypothetical protein RLZZ127_1239, partial [Planctomycetota bacterium]